MEEYYVSRNAQKKNRNYQKKNVTASYTMEHREFWHSTEMTVTPMQCL